MRIVFHEKAEEELIEAARHYEESAAGLGHAFLDEIAKSINEILSYPQSGVLLSDEIHGKLLRRFPYRLMYAVEQDGIVILAIAHHKRRPGYWLPRR